MTTAAASPGSRSRRRGKRIAAALALATVGVLGAAVVILQDEVAARWYEYRLDRGPPQERQETIRKLGATGTDRAMRRLLKVLVEDAPRTAETSAPTTSFSWGLLKVPVEVSDPDAARQALTQAGPRALPFARAIIAEVVASGDREELKRLAQRLSPLVVSLGDLDDWARPITGRWIADLDSPHAPAGKAADKLQALGEASLPGLLGGLEGDKWFRKRWCESLLWQMAEKSEAACRGLLHAYARADAQLRPRIAQVLESAGENGKASIERAVADPQLSRAAREALDELARRRPSTSPPPRG